MTCRGSESRRVDHDPLLHGVAYIHRRNGSCREKEADNVEDRGWWVWAPAWRRAGGRAGKSNAQQSGRKPIFEGAGPLSKLYFKVPGVKRPQAGYYKIVLMLRHSFHTSVWGVLY